MKFNWGHGLTIAIIICVGGILWLVWVTVKSKVDLVTEEYYPKELVYEQQLQKMRNNNKLKQKVVVQIRDSLYVYFPKVVTNPDSIKGQILFYRPSDKNKDFKEKIHLDNAFKASYPLSKFDEGKYEMTIDWAFSGIPCMQKEVVFFEKK